MVLPGGNPAQRRSFMMAGRERRRREESMHLGILVNSDDRLRIIIGLTRAASAGGHQVTIFAMDEGTRLLEAEDFVALAGESAVSMSYCDHSARQLRVNTAMLPGEIECSSQFSNAAMVHNADKVLVL